MSVLVRTEDERYREGRESIRRHLLFREVDSVCGRIDMFLAFDAEAV